MEVNESLMSPSLYGIGLGWMENGSIETDITHNDLKNLLFTYPCIWYISTKIDNNKEHTHQTRMKYEQRNVA